MRYATIFVVCLPLFFYNTIKAQIPSVETNAQLDVLVESGQYLEAVAYCQATVEQLSDDSRAGYLEQLADLYQLYLEMPDRAEEAYRQVLENHPGSNFADDAAYNLGMMAYMAGDNTKALRYFDLLIGRYPDSPRVHNAQFVADRIRQGRYSAPLKKKQIYGQFVRVLLKQGESRVLLQASGGFDLSGRVLPQQITALLNRGRVYIGAQEFDSEVTLTPRSGIFALGDGRRFRGAVRLIVDRNGLQVINVVDLESYLKGVVPKEMPASWPAQALRSQAVAARTYVAYQMARRQNSVFDVMATTASQVYGGLATEQTTSSQAVDETRGQVLMYEGQPILAYYHAHSGGYVEDDGTVFPSNLPYLQAMPDAFCLKTEKGAFDWVLTIKGHALLQAIGKTGTLNSVRIVTKSDSGRVRRIAINSHEMDAVWLRMRLGPERFKSTFFEVSQHGNDVVFKGRGNGHGVGMSQWSVLALSQSRSYRDILSHFYPHTQLQQLEDE